MVFSLAMSFLIFTLVMRMAFQSKQHLQKIIPFNQTWANMCSSNNYNCYIFGHLNHKINVKPLTFSFWKIVSTTHSSWTMSTMSTSLTYKVYVTIALPLIGTFSIFTSTLKYYSLASSSPIFCSKIPLAFAWGFGSLAQKVMLVEIQYL